MDIRAGLSSLLLLPLAGCPDPAVPSNTTEGDSADSGSTGESASGSGEGTADETSAGSQSASGETGPGELCGDGVVEGSEECDDGAESATCNADCTAAACGDGVVNGAAGEECDDGGETAACDDDCTAVACGDANHNEAAGEECDDGAETATCDVDCTMAMCGDSTFNMTAGEECDDGGKSPACDADCTGVSCGDGVFNPNAGELCDDGGESALCNADCTPASCGDGVVNMAASEECDTMGESVTCDGNCTLAMCGDLTINATLGEECDGANLAGQTCQSLGFMDGVLTCDVATCGFDTSGCSSLCPPFVAGSIDADIVASAPTLEQTRMTIAWDGASLWTSSGGSSGGIRLVEHDPMGAFLMGYSPGLDMRAVFTQGDGTTPLYARAYSNNVIQVQMAPGVFMSDVTLVGGTLDSQASVAWNPVDSRFIAQVDGVIDRWDPTGSYTDSVVLVGYGIGNELVYPQNRGIAFGSGCYLTIDDGTLSSWDPQGNRIDTIVLNQAIPGNFDHNFSVSFARGRAWHGTNPDWHGYDVFGTAP